MSKSAIEWTEATWNPVVGCSILSPGCTNCYAMKMAARIEAMARANWKRGVGPAELLHGGQYLGTTTKVNGSAVWTGKLAMAPDHILLQPLKRKKPTTYFVNSMGDLFHEDVPFEWIRKVFGVMARCPQHTFQILTKRAARMQEAVTRMVEHPMDGTIIAPGQVPDAPVSLKPIGIEGVHMYGPLPNVWLGVSTERQQEADERIPLLLQTPAAIRFISTEPLLGPIDLTRIKLQGIVDPFDAFAGATWSQPPSLNGARFFSHNIERKDRPKLDWVIVGGESGPGSRPMHPGWARSLRDQCSAAGVPFFFKQWGESIPIGQTMHGPGRGRQLKPEFFSAGAGAAKFDYARVGKKSAGRALDGMIHDEYPEGAR